MKKVSYTGPMQRHFEGFGKSCERTCKGSLIFLPNQQKLISDGEYDHIREAYPHEVKYLRCQKLPSEERVVLGKRKGQANSAKPRDPAKAKQMDGNLLHLAAAKVKQAKAKTGNKGKGDKQAPPENVVVDRPIEEKKDKQKDTRKKK